MDDAVTPISTEMGDSDPATICFAPVIQRWRDLRQKPGDLPSCRDFQPDSLAEFPSRVSVIEPVDGGQDFRFVIYAAAIVEASGIDMTGYCFSEMHVEALRVAMSLNAQLVLSERQPRIWRYRHGWKDSQFDYCCLYMPLQYGDGARVRIHSVIVNTDPTRRQLYKGRFEKTRHAVKPDQYLTQMKGDYT